MRELKPIPNNMRSGMRGKLAHIHVLCEELAELYIKQKPMTREEAAMAAGLLVRLGKKTKETLTLGAEIHRLMYLE